MLKFPYNPSISKTMKSQLRTSVHCHGQLSCLSSPVTLPSQRAGFPCLPPRKSSNGVWRARTKDWAHCQGPLKDKKVACYHLPLFFLLLHPTSRIPRNPRRSHSSWTEQHPQSYRLHPTLTIFSPITFHSGKILPDITFLFQKH